MALQWELNVGITHTCNLINALWHCQKGVKGLLVSRRIWPIMFIHAVASAESQSLPHSQEKGLFSLGDINTIWWLQSTGAQSVLREDHRGLFGTQRSSTLLWWVTQLERWYFQSYNTVVYPEDLISQVWSVGIDSSSAGRTEAEDLGRLWQPHCGQVFIQLAYEMWGEPSQRADVQCWSLCTACLFAEGEEE